MSTLGIYLGNNSISVYSNQNGRISEVFIRGGRGLQGKVFPAYVEFNQDGTMRHVGKKAYDDYCIGNDAPIIWGVNRLIGSSWEEAKARREFRHLGYLVERSDDGGIVIPVGDKCYTPVDILLILLNKIKEDAVNPQLNIQNRIDRVVITIPAYFDGSRREATLRAVRLVFSNLPAEAIYWIPEPIALALGYGLLQHLPPQGGTMVCVINLGAGTLEVVKARLGYGANGVVMMMPSPSCSNAAFGGIDIDDILVDWVIREGGLLDFQQIREQMAEGNIANTVVAVDLRRELRQLRAALETAKIHLSDLKRRPQETFNYSYKGECRTLTLTGEIIDREMDRPLSEERVNELIGYHLTPTEEQALLEALTRYHPAERRVTPSFLDLLRLNIENGLTKDNYTINDIDHVLLTGGPMHMPCIRKAIREVFATNERVLNELEEIEDHGFPVDPMQCVARGAALYRGDKGEDNEVGTKSTKCHYGLMTAEGELAGYKYICLDRTLLIEIGNSIPCRVTAKKLALRSISGEKEIPIIFLKGDTALLLRDKRIIWKKSVVHSYKPVYDGNGEAHYSITLQVDGDSVNITVQDAISTKTYDLNFDKVVETDPLVVSQYPFDVYTGTPQALSKYLVLLYDWVEEWLEMGHLEEEKKNRDRVIWFNKLIPTLVDDLKTISNRYENLPGNLLITDQIDLYYVYRGAFIVRLFARFGIVLDGILDKSKVTEEITEETMEKVRLSFAYRPPDLYFRGTLLRDEVGNILYLNSLLTEIINELSRGDSQ